MSTETKKPNLKSRTQKSQNLKSKSKPRKQREHKGYSLPITNFSAFKALLQPKLTTQHLLRHEPESDDENVVVVESKKDQSAPLVAQNGSDCKEMVLYSVSKDSLKGMLGLGRRGRQDMHMTFELFAGSPMTTASSAGSYFPLFTAFSSGNVLWATVIGALQEFNSLDVLFDEFFVSKIVANFKPNNRYGLSTGFTTMEDTRASVSFLPDNSGPYTNTSTTWISMRSAIESADKITSDPWRFVMKNPTKLVWDGPIGDQTTAQSNMGWCSFANSSTYGGIMQMAFPYATAASATATTLPESLPFGTMLFCCTVHVRARA
jgi:hypothetical protein